MSYEAEGWARKQKCGSPGAKLVLERMAAWADDECIVWPSQKKLASETEQSVDSVARHLSTLLERGLIEKHERKVRRDGSKGPVVYRLLLDLEQWAADQQANRVPPRGGLAKTVVVSAATPDVPTHAADCGMPHAADCGGETRNLQGPTPQIAGSRILPGNLTRESSPLPPEGGSGADASPRDGQGERTEGESQRFDRLKAAYPPDGARMIRPAREAFALLAPEEQDLAARCASAYAAFCRERCRKPKDLGNWLKGRGWEGFSPIAVTATPVGTAPARPTEWVLADSPEGEAWSAHHRERGERPRWIETNRGFGGYRVMRWPPGHPNAGDAPAAAGAP